MNTTKALIETSADRVEKWVEAQNYRGYEPFDGLSSFLKPVTMGNVFAERLLQQLVRQSPVNLRPIFGVSRKDSTKGRGYMAWGYIRKFKITDDNIESFATGANSNFPQTVDNILRFEGIKTMPGKNWIYRVTILNTADISKVVEQLNSAGRQNILNTIKTAKDMKQLRDSDVTIWYEYSDEAGNLLLTLKFTPEEYKK